MKKIVKLTEADLTRIVRRVIKEQPNDRFVDNLANNRNQAKSLFLLLLFLSFVVLFVILIF